MSDPTWQQLLEAAYVAPARETDNTVKAGMLTVTAPVPPGWDDAVLDRAVGRVNGAPIGQIPRGALFFTVADLAHDRLSIILRFYRMDRCDPAALKPEGYPEFDFNTLFATEGA